MEAPQPSLVCSLKFLPFSPASSPSSPEAGKRACLEPGSADLSPVLLLLVPVSALPGEVEPLAPRTLPLQTAQSSGHAGQVLHFWSRYSRPFPGLSAPPPIVEVKDTHRNKNIFVLLPSCVHRPLSMRKAGALGPWLLPLEGSGSWARAGTVTSTSEAPVLPSPTLHDLCRKWVLCEHRGQSCPKSWESWFQGSQTQDSSLKQDLMTRTWKRMFPALRASLVLPREGPKSRTGL